MSIIPLRGGSRGDQVENARIFENAGAAVNFCADLSAEKSEDSSDSTIEKSAEKLSALVAELAMDEHRRKAMAASKIGGTTAADRIAETLAQRTGAE
jgi:UDP-N-acetylglucosamine--N-acetylmuramyl-(pentapeptide) pyrophosphoryl-undecaprenol N-acetylglucosamine transferase